MTKVLMKGNEAIARAAIKAGCQAYFGYPITPQSELLECIAKELPEADKTFIQAESELAAISMIYGAAATGVRCMTSTSSPGFSLMQEGISYLACAELPCVIVNVARGGPGLGTIQPGQADYFQATRGGGHGDYRTIVLAPSSVQEAAQLTIDAFNLSMRYRIPVIILSDGMLGQMAESTDLDKIHLPKNADACLASHWKLQGAQGREAHKIVPFDLDPERLEYLNFKLEAKHQELEKWQTRCEYINLENADIVLVAYGIVGRIAKTVIEEAKSEGINVGLIRPITLWPFPKISVDTDILVVEMSVGQMIEDVRLATAGKNEVHLLGRAGGTIPTQGEIIDKICQILGHERPEQKQKRLINPYAEGDFLKPRRIQLVGMRKVRTRPKSLTDNPFSYCPGCHHSTAHRLIAEVIDELEIRERTISVFCVGCAVFGYKFFDIDSVVPAHGRAQAVATAIKREHPDKIVFAYQGDGDLASIGLAETIYAANRGENFTTIFINNAIYGMTGGQMAPTTLLNQKTTTTIRGRGSETGHPLKVSEILANLENTAFVTRTALINPILIAKTKKAIKKAFRLQIEGKGYSCVEILSACPTNWKKSPQESLTFIDNEMTKTFPLGVLKDIEGGKS